MIKRILLFLLQLIAFAVLLMIGGYWDFVRLYLQFKQPALNVIPLWKFHISANYDLVANGIFFAAILLVLILIFEALRKRLRPWATLSVLAFVLAVVVSLFARLGLPPSHS